MDFYARVFEAIDLRSFSNLWYWIGLAVFWSSVSYWVLGVPWDLIQRARRGDDEARAQDMQDIVRVNVNRLLLIGQVSGLATALWIHEVFGAEAEDVWRGLKGDIVTVTSGWSEAYGMFTEGEADMVLSFTTSPAYHLIAEGDDTVKAAIFPEGHYVLVETVGRVSDTDAARAFMDFVLTPAFQGIIPTGNWSFPAAQAGDLPEGFERLNMPETVIHLPSP